MESRMQRHLSTGSTLISALLARDRPARPARRADLAFLFGIAGPPSSPRKDARGHRGSRSGHSLGALIQIIARSHADMVE
ncbi:hypothetical protein AA12717_2026 [Gluconacetobacter sacchari DSM 12717]|nr:hypothetical protein AA12717_2026 [Gluconacetobacter sacchari DSM 12717]